TLVYFSVDRSTYDNTRQEIDSSLAIGRSVFQRLIEEREATFRITSRALTLDYAFRTAYSSGDSETMLSVSENLLSRVENADMMMVIDFDYQILADTMRLYSPGAQVPWPYLVEDAENADNYEAASFVMIREIPHQIVAVPILTPIVDGWIIVGRRLDNNFVSGLKDIINSDVSIMIIDAQGRGRSLASTLADNHRDSLDRNFQIGDMPLQQSALLALDADDFVSLANPLVQRDELTLIALIQQSLDEALTPYRQLEQRLLILFGITLALSAGLAILLGRSVTRPVLALAQRVKLIEGGDYTRQLDLQRRDEIGQLADSVNNMAGGLAEKEKVRDLLGKVVSREIAEELLSRKVELGGETRVVTILFSDVRNFTTLCEDKNPEQVLSLLNNYLSQISNVIEANQGVVDKFIGDAVMALYGAPVAGDKDIVNALNSALELKQTLHDLNRDNQAQGLPTLQAGIGLHTGPVVAGNLGSANRLNYTVIGDTVNLAARLEALTRQYGIDIIVSEDIRRQGPGFVYRELDLVRVKGKQQAVRIFELMGREGQVGQASVIHAARFEQMLRLFRTQQWPEAESLLEQIQTVSSDQPLVRLYRQRIAQYRQSPPPSDWDGTHTLTEK
ncbi:MAG: adenylate/guanylate cyclase domain-containing protein, partial [Pseudohongiellaceae bacterium]